jgi:hypothetical protein
MYLINSVSFQSLLDNPLSSIFTKYIAFLQDTKTEELLKFYNACTDYRYHTAEPERDIKVFVESLPRFD